MSAIQILKKFWGYESFRSPQLDIINQVIAQKDVVGILPTGSGKSIIYQVAGLMQEGITVVISPLIALIEDQSATLRNLGIENVALTGNLSFPELERLLDNAVFGNTKFLFLSPERLQNEYVQRRLAKIKVNLIVVDEAHCISEWGHDFRPSYLKIAKIRELLPSVPVLALTATAKSKVVKDIEIFLDLHNTVIFNESVFRKNIAYKVQFADDKITALTQNIDKNETAIVYVRTRKRSLQMADLFARRGYKTGFFHGGMSFAKKQKSLNDWLQNKHRVMFSTTAFGMGINKADVRKVVHLDLPESLENYVQESGRAGRDGKISEAVMLLATEDIDFYKNFYLENLPTIDEVYKVYKNLYNHFYIAEDEGAGVQKSLDYEDFCNRFNLNKFQTMNILQMLNSEEFIQISQGRRYQSGIRIVTNPTATRNYIAQKRFGYQVLNYLVRSYTDILILPIKIKLSKLSKVLEIPRNNLHKIFVELQRRGIIEYQPEQEDFSILFLLSRDEYTFKYKSKSIVKRIAHKKEQMQQVLAYVSNNQTCRAVFLANYFEEKTIQNCHICDVCTASNKTENIEIKILELLKEKCLHKTEIQAIVSADISEILHILLEQERITFRNFKYCLPKA